MANYIDELKDVIRRLHQAEATHVESVPVKESFQGKTVWDGIVEVFDLKGHPTAFRVYAWAHDYGSRLGVQCPCLGSPKRKSWFKARFRVTHKAHGLVTEQIRKEFPDHHGRRRLQLGA